VVYYNFLSVHFIVSIGRSGRKTGGSGDDAPEADLALDPLESLDPPLERWVRGEELGEG
jgi:hypothetical protein